MCRDTLPLGGNVYIFRGRRGDLVKILWASEDGIWLLANYLASYYNSFS
ncbi:transposase [Paraburkholderia youngii]